MGRGTTPTDPDHQQRGGLDDGKDPDPAGNHTNSDPLGGLYRESV